MTHPEEYTSSRFKDKFIPHDIISEYAISNTINLWIKYFLSLGIRLEKFDSNFGYDFNVRYNGNGFYELRFTLEKEEDDGLWLFKQNIPYDIQSEIESLIDADERNFIDCDTWIGEIYVSLDYEKYFMKYERTNMINNLLNKMKENIEIK
jgi:hypothetical protein